MKRYEIEAQKYVDCGIDDDQQGVLGSSSKETLIINAPDIDKAMHEAHEILDKDGFEIVWVHFLGREPVHRLHEHM